ncbi:MAG: LptA/OstA family protein [Kiritimatiellia bacterium]|nr:LptA/OstA family protein [Kiritimatiellia bacterium]
MTRFIIMALLIQSVVLYPGFADSPSRSAMAERGASSGAETTAGSKTAGADPVSATQASAVAQRAMADKSPEAPPKREGFADSPSRSAIHSETSERVAEREAMNDTNCTVITSRKLTFDQKKSTVVFEGNVVATDPALKIESDRLTVLLSNDKKVESIRAEGSVVITRDTIRAVSQIASYAVPDGKITLSGKPHVIRQKDYLSAETIVLWRNSNRIICEPNAHLIIYSEQNVQGP